jgi:redox-sensitive bicupin YhaK (pirin superfamily)
MLTVRRAKDRGHARHGWLDTWHTFSFADYQDPRWMGFRGLRVLNDDTVVAGAGFPTHGHRDMEIVTYVLEGALEHKDSLGTGSVIRPGDVQRMSAGTGVRHSEFNASKSEPVHFLQIWILPDRAGHDPGYEQKAFPMAERRGQLVLVASPDGADGSVTVHADTRLYAAKLGPGDAVELALRPGRHAWIHTARGAAESAGQALAAGDGLGIAPEGDPVRVHVRASGEAEILLFDLA